MITVYLVSWYISGLIGCCLGAYTDNKRGEDIKLSDFFKSLVISLFGLFVLILGMFHFCKYNFKDVVLIKGKTKQ